MDGRKLPQGNVRTPRPMTQTSYTEDSPTNPKEAAMEEVALVPYTRAFMLDGEPFSAFKRDRP